MSSAKTQDYSKVWERISLMEAELRDHYAFVVMCRQFEFTALAEPKAMESVRA